MNSSFSEITPRFSAGIFYRRKQLWLSELTGIIFVFCIVACLSSFGILVAVKDRHIRSNNALLSQMKVEKASVEDILEDLRNRELISATLTEFGRGRLSRQTINILADLVCRNSRTFGYDPLLVCAVIHVESVFETSAQGKYSGGNYSGALGLMQIKFETAREVARDLDLPLERDEDLFVPEINIALGVAYLSRLIAKFRSLKLGILAYNQGPGAVNKSIKGNQPLSQKYYQKVLKSYFTLKEMHQRRTSVTSFQ